MKTRIKGQLSAFFMFAILFLAALLSTADVAAQTKAPIKNVVLVHGAFADGSGWRSLYEVLTKKGYNVTIVQNPLTSLEDDVAATNVVLDKQDGPTILVGHSWGGTVITQAGNHSKVVGLVYVAAFQPDQGESALQWLQTAPPASENGVLNPDDKGIVYYDKAKFHAGFCADISKEEAEFMYASQGAFYAKGFVTPITKAAWRDKPAYAVIATEDKSINPDIQRVMYKRSNSKATEVKGSHVVFMSQPKAVADVIIAASKEIAVKN
ncbi:alpha/beta hydrolase [Pedobacter sp. HDW13]|uniref:alpha/beta hydrolase n=1 Tax=unclassified Pedobacter TaxID=2628915 RepID=UPI000F5A69FC|nr:MULTISPECIES: alpha/beta hydrolase [unclassified Pedobacter]QIL38235.1 alpha/beta hydrolase [Pedobacter sp. HDW13]RQO73671.1 alpha/beta hydrolase [Pedobacter sp. KBW01]